MKIVEAKPKLKASYIFIYSGALGRVDLPAFNEGSFHLGVKLAGLSFQVNDCDIRPFSHHQTAEASIQGSSEGRALRFV